MSKHDVTGWYGDVFNGWQADLLGRKPTAAELATIHALGARPGKQALANAMALRSTGVTGSQIVIACGAPQLNKMRGFISDGVVKRVPMSPVNGHTVYRLELTAKGAAKVKAAQAAPADKPKAAPKAAKVKAASKPRKPKAAPAPVTTEAPAPAPAPVEATPQADTAPVEASN